MSQTKVSALPTFEIYSSIRKKKKDLPKLNVYAVVSNYHRYCGGAIDANISLEHEFITIFDKRAQLDFVPEKNVEEVKMVKPLLL